MICVSIVSVSPSSVNLEVGKWYYGASAQVYPTTATCKEVTWYSANTSVASVNASSGFIYGVAPGTTKIYAKATDGSDCRDYLTVTVSGNVPVSSVTLDRSSLSLEIGQSAPLEETVCPENATNRSVIWCSSDDDIAKVTTTGVVTAVSEGTAVITATATDGSGKSASCTVTVTGHVLVSTVTLCPDQKTMITEESALLYAEVCPENAYNKCLLWSSSNSSVATVNPNSGLVIAQSRGSAVITAAAQDGSGKVGRCNLTVEDPVCIERIILCPDELILEKSETKNLDVTILPLNATYKTLKWTSTRPSVATVGERSGRIIARGAGETYIFADAQDGSEVRAFCKVKVKQTVTEATVDPIVNELLNNLVADPVDAYTGAHLLTNTLMQLFGGQGLKLEAKYNSTQLVEGLLGVGWYLNIEKHVEIRESEARVYSSPTVYSPYTAQNDSCTVFACTSPQKNGYVLTVDSTALYPYTVNCNSARTECYNANGDLAKIIDHQGFEITLTYASSLITITDSVSGKSIYLEKDLNCRIVRVYDDAGRQAVLSYFANFLSTVCDVNGNTISYSYDSVGRVLSGTDAKGTRFFENTYDELGRVCAQRDGITGSQQTVFSYEDDRRITTNRNGKQSTREYDCNGLLVKYTDENGNAVSYEYDDHYNVIKETDAKGNYISRTFNSFHKPTQIIDKNGNITNYTYDANGNLTKITYPAVNGVQGEEVFAYNSRNQLTQYTDLRGTITVYSYDDAGMLVSKKVGSKNAELYTYQNGLCKTKTDARGNTTSFAHNTLGQVSSQTDANGNTTEYTYDGNGNLLRTVDAKGKTTVTAYDGNYQKISYTDAKGNKTDYSYNGNLKNTLITLPDGHSITYAFDGEDRIISETDQANNVTTMVYDDGGRLISKRFADGAIEQYEYDAVGNVIKETNPNGAVTVKTYDKNGNILSVTDNNENVTTYEYNAMSKMTKQINAVAGTTVYVYSAAGDLMSETDALGNVKSYTYDAFGNKLTETDARNNVTAYTYDANNNLLTVKDALNHVTTYTYNSLNQCVSVKDALNHTVEYGYDALGRITTITDAKGNVFTTAYDANGNVTRVIDAKGNIVSRTTYNCLNQPSGVTNALGKTTTYTYNALGKVENVTDPMMHNSIYVYNTRGQNIGVLDAMGNSSSATYDALGNVTRLAGPLGGATAYTYDAMGRLTGESTVSGGTVSYTYNELNLRKKLTNAKGQIRQFFYDAKGRITGCTTPEGTISYTYDANDNVLTAADSHGTITRTYDALNRVISCTDSFNKTIRYEYDAIGNLSKLIYPDNTAVTYAYDANRNLVTVTDWANRVTTYTYDVNNRVTGVTKPDGSVTTTVYDTMQRVISTVERNALGTVISGFEYTYDELSRIVEELVLEKSQRMCYTYDNLNRVVGRTTKDLSNNVLSVESYSYDAAGNLTDAPDSCFLYDINNRLTTFNGHGVSYDLDGNMLSNGSLTCTYDSANRLLTAGGNTYTYNAEDVRISSLSEGVTTTYTYHTNCKLSQLLTKTTGSAVTKYVYGQGLIGEESDNTFKTYHFDSRGSTVAVTDASGNISDTFAYDTYGKLLSRTGTDAVIFGYNGRDGVVTEDNGLIYMRARYYSPDMRRFLNTDIVPGELSQAITLNRFAYANGNPVSFVDPFGLSAERGSLTQEQCEIFGETLKSFMILSKKVGLRAFRFKVGPYVFYQKQDMTCGTGKIDVDDLLAGQIELAVSKDLLAGSFSYKTGTKGSWGIEYSMDFDAYHSIAASATFDADGTMSMESQITSKTELGYSVTTTTGIKADLKNNAPWVSPVVVEEESLWEKVTQGFAEAADDLKDVVKPVAGVVTFGLSAALFVMGLGPAPVAPY